MTDSWNEVDLVMTTIIDTCLANEKYFGDLDSVVGDGDFGYSMARGFEQVLEKFDDFDRTDLLAALARLL
jgi:DAK2 domain.